MQHSFQHMVAVQPHSQNMDTFFWAFCFANPPSVCFTVSVFFFTFWFVCLGTVFYSAKMLLFILRVFRLFV